MPPCRFSPLDWPRAVMPLDDRHSSRLEADRPCVEIFFGGVSVSTSTAMGAALRVAFPASAYNKKGQRSSSQMHQVKTSGTKNQLAKWHLLQHIAHRVHSNVVGV